MESREHYDFNTVVVVSRHRNWSHICRKRRNITSERANNVFEITVMENMNVDDKLYTNKSFLFYKFL